ncbi:MAG: hypothetical protein ABEJ60_00865 [Halodesulfurarchaeum sp.]
MDLEPKRRRFLELAGTGMTLSLAGCSAPSPSGTRAATEEIGERVTVTLALEIDQQALQNVRRRLTQKLQNGTINRTEAQKQFYAAEENLLKEAASAFRDRIAGLDSIAVTKSAPRIGVLLVSGTPAALIETLSYQEVRGLFPEGTFQRAVEQVGDGD